jgi:uncharacterized protein YndB with AHSA1/START domain
MKTSPDATIATTNEQQLVITRVFDAARERVWKAWTEPERLKRWFGPQDFTVPVCSVDLRVGGSFHLSMRSPDGKDYWVKGVYREITPPARLVYADYFSDKGGNIVSPTAYGMSTDFPVESLITVTLEEREGKTKMTLQSAAPSGRERDDAEAGWNQSFDKLADNLRGGE